MLKQLNMLLGVLLLSISCTLEALPAQVIIIRHGEKPSSGNNLSLKGEQRAAALVPFFQGNLIFTQFGVPVAIYAEQPEPDGKRGRPLLTVTPLAAALNLIPIATHDKDRITDMTQEIISNPEYAEKMVLICWEHTDIPTIAEALGVKKAPKWSGKIFDRIWILTYDQSGKLSFANLPQKLLYGDSSK